jgi:hypothetical protein
MENNADLIKARLDICELQTLVKLRTEDMRHLADRLDDTRSELRRVDTYTAKQTGALIGSLIGLAILAPAFIKYFMR